MSQFFERPKLKSIIHYYLNQYCEMEQLMVKEDIDKIVPIEMPAAFTRNMKVFIIEIIPTILVSDGHNFIEAVFSKESINEFRKNYSHVKFSNLRDKIIQLGKWSLQIDHVNSRNTFNSHSNVNIKLIIEQFRPQMQETLTTRLTHKATSIFKNEEIKALIQNFRHWHSMTSIRKEAFSVQSIQTDNGGQIKSCGNNLKNDLVFPELKEVLGLNKQVQSVHDGGKKSIGQRNTRAKKHFQNDHNSQNTTQLSDKSDCNIISSDEVFNFGGNIQNSQVFRIGLNEFENLSNLKQDYQQDNNQFILQAKKLNQLQVKDIRITDLERVVIQEMGEQYYAEKKYAKSRQWQDLVEDEFRREELKQRIDYFNVGGDDAQKNDCQYETLWQREEREKHQKRLLQSNGYNSRRIVGYTFNQSSNIIKDKLIKLLDSSKTSAQIEEEKKLILAKATSPQKIMGRPRANSQENILQIENVDNSNSQLCSNNLLMNMNREPLSQFVTVNNVFNDDTQSEQDSMDAEMNAQNNQERQKKRQKNEDEDLNDILQNVQPLGISMFRSYLQWFDKKDLQSSNFVEKLPINEEEILFNQESAEKIKKQNFKMVIAGRTRSSRTNKQVNDTESEHQAQIEEKEEDQEDERLMEEVSQTNLIQPQSVQDVKEAQSVVNNLENTFNEIKYEDELMQNEEVIHEEVPLQSSQKLDSEENQENILSEVSLQQEPIQQYAQQVNPVPLEKEENQEQYLDLSSPQFDTEDKQNHVQVSKSESVKSKDEEEVQIEEQKPVEDQQIKYESPIKPILFSEIKQPDSGVKQLLEPSPAKAPPKPIEQMTNGEKAMWDIQVEFQKMQEQINQQQRMMQQMFEKKQLEAQRLIKEEEERAERERLEKIRLEKERLEKERLERERLEKERLEQERLEKERQEKLRLMRERQKQEQDKMTYEDNLMKQYVKEEKIRIEQERLRKEAEMLRLQQELEKKRQEEERLRLQKEQELKEKQRLEAEQKEQERLRLEQQVKLEAEKQKQIQIDKQMRERQAIEMEKKRRMAKLIEEQKQKQKQMEHLKRLEKQRSQLVEDDEDLDWTNDENKAAPAQQPAVEQINANNDQEMTLEEESSDLDDQVKELDMKRQDYISRMSNKHEGTLNKQIREMETKDMSRRNIKHEENQDKLFDFLKIKDIKQEKIEQQRKQLLQETSSSQKDSKENSISETEQRNIEENRGQVIKNENQVSANSSSKISESDGQIDQDANLNQFNLFEQQNNNEEQFDELLTQSYEQGEHVDEEDNQDPINIEQQQFDDVEEIIPQQMQAQNNVSQQAQRQSFIETPPQSKQISTYSESNGHMSVEQNNDGGKVTAENQTLKALQEQLSNLHKMFANVSNQIQHLSSQQQQKQNDQIQDSGIVQNEQVDQDDNELTERESDEDFHLPAFGSQVQNQQEKKKSKSNRSPKKKNEVQPFSLPSGVGQKRNFKNYEDGQKYQLPDDATDQQVKDHYASQYKNQVQKTEDWSNLTDFVQFKTLERQKDQIKADFNKREQKKLLQRQQMRQNGGLSQRNPQMERQMQNHQMQKRERSMSRDRQPQDQSQRAPQQFQQVRNSQGQNSQSQPQMRQMQGHQMNNGQQRQMNPNFQNNQMQRNGQRPQQQRPQQPVRYSARGPGPQQFSPRKSQGQMPQNQNIGGTKRYVQSQQSQQYSKESDEQQKVFNSKMNRIKEQQQHEF